MLTRATERPDASAARKDPRLRALYRRELQRNVRLAASVVAVGTSLAAVSSILSGGSISALYTFVALPVVLVAAACGVAVKRRGRHYVVEVGMLVGLLPAIDSAAAVTMSAPSSAFAIGGVALVPLAFSVLVPLERRDHLKWLLMVNLVYLTFTAPLLLTGNALGDGRAIAMIAAASLGTAVSVWSNDIEQSRRARMNGQLIGVRQLYARMKEHELDLRRQDEFLFMQQETLVVQQAELLRLNEELETIARIDALTGLGNRLRLNEDLAQLAGRIERNGGSAGLLLMDLDRFKRLNDVAGHLAGDAALRGVADVLRKTSRVGDGLYRYGGEEFLIVLHDCNATDVRGAGQRYVTAIEAAGMAHPDNPPYGVVTASAGAVVLSPANCVDIDVALHDADEALYVAKSRGRNRIEVTPMPREAAFTADQQRAAS